MTVYRDNHVVYHGRRRLLLLMFLLCLLVLLGRAFYLQVVQHEFLVAKAERGHYTNLDLPARRGMITDRNGKVLAVSTPVGKVWYHPREGVKLSAEQRAFLQQLLNIGSDKIVLAEKSSSRRYLSKVVPYDLLDQLKAARLPGLGMERAHRRYYPQKDIFSHVLGYTNFEDQGQEGLEKAFDEFLAGHPGKRKVLRDRRGNVLEHVSELEPMRPGQSLRLSLDERIQYLAYEELKYAVDLHQAASGSVVVLDVNTGEVLAMVSQPSFNPNDGASKKAEWVRNRAVKDLFEPGSTFKPFTLAAALESGLYTEHSIIDTSPGSVKVGSHLIEDIKNYGRMDFSTLLSRSSNVGASKVSLSIPKESFWQMLDKIGFGRSTDSGFPYEAGGSLRDYDKWVPLDRAVISYGYGVNVTPLQLAQGYAVIAADGMRRPVSFIAQDGVNVPERVMSAATAGSIRQMMQQVVSPSNTGYKAAVEGYRVSGKTGTSRKLVNRVYSDKHHVATFAGMAPAESPELVIVVVIDDPQGKSFSGGDVAAPVFSNIMQSALRLLNVQPERSLINEGFYSSTSEVSL